ncbi:MAG TPA: sensor histidine kinase [Actinopolymorphaceae bacterium]
MSVAGSDQAVGLNGGLHRRRWRGAVFGGLWLIFLVSPVYEALQSAHGLLGRILVVGVATAFAALHLALLAIGLQLERRRAKAGMLVALSLLAAAFCALDQAGLFSFVYLASAGVMVLPNVLAIGWVAALVGLTAALPVVLPGWTANYFITLAVMLGAVASFGYTQLLRRNLELRQAQEEIARLAVADERLRFARDLHDLLGHSLTVIAVKAELAGRLVQVAPERAGEEIRDVERLAREALADVRATVAGYRARSLTAELSLARGTLEAAGIEADLPRSVEAVSGANRDVFGWVLREAVTNVVRHSNAKTCRVELTPTSIEIVDDGTTRARPRVDRRDGRKPEADSPNGHVTAEEIGKSGQGLVGLRERVEAVGGRLEAGPMPSGGFRVFATIPWPDEQEEPAGTSRPRPAQEAGR